MRLLVSTVIAVFCCGNLHAQAVPDAGKFLPGPPAETSVEYIKDYLQYAWGKTMRGTEIGEQARNDFNANAVTVMKSLAESGSADLGGRVETLELANKELIIRLDKLERENAELRRLISKETTR